MGSCMSTKPPRVTNFDDEPIFTVSPKFRLELQRSHFEGVSAETPDIALPSDINPIRELSSSLTDSVAHPPCDASLQPLSMSLNQELSEKFASLSSDKQDSLLAELDFSELSSVAFQQMVELARTYPKIKPYIDKSLKANSQSAQSYKYTQISKPGNFF